MKNKTLLVISILFFSFAVSPCLAKDYDGLWFMGFNMRKPVFNGNKGLALRKAVNYAINREYICKEIIGDENVPTGVIPKDCEGYDPSLKGFPFDPVEAKRLLAKAGFKKNDKRIKNMVLIHTDGDKTIRIADAIRSDLSNIGISLKFKQIPYGVEGRWEKELEKGKEELFLMGYKALPIYDEASNEAVDSARYISDLFSSDGDANMNFLKDKKIDSLLDRIGSLDAAEKEKRLDLLKKAGLYLQDNPVTVNLFYIEELK